MLEFHFVQNKLSFQTCQGAAWTSDWGSLLSLAITGYFHCICPHIPSQSRSMAALRNSWWRPVSWCGRRSKLWCLCTKEFCVFSVFALPSYHLLTDCKLPKGAFSTSTWNSQNIYLESNWSPSCFNMMHCFKIIHPLYLAIFYFMV